MKARHKDVRWMLSALGFSMAYALRKGRDPKAILADYDAAMLLVARVNGEYEQGRVPDPLEVTKAKIACGGLGTREPFDNRPQTW